MAAIINQPSRLERWFPTFSKIFQFFLQSPEEVDHPIDHSPAQPKPLDEFFLHNVGQLEGLETASRDQLLEKLQWITLKTTHQYLPPQGYSLQAEKSLLTDNVSIEEISSARDVVPEQQEENPGFFIQGLVQISNLDSLMGVDVLRLLNWEQEGQTLLAIDPDDYGLLDDLLDSPAPVSKKISPVVDIKQQGGRSPDQGQDEPSHFFIKGLSTKHTLGSLKNTDLVQSLQWESQGQTLLEIDPDDYELLDDLLEVFPTD